MLINDELPVVDPAPAIETAPTRLDTLDGYRAIAAIGVLVYHTAGWVGFINPREPGAHIIDNLGNFGVAVFFVISGFLLFRPFVLASLTEASPPATAPFYIRRALRIYPAYWLALIGWAMVAAPSERVAGTTVGKLLLIDPYDLGVREWEVGLGVSWTLTIEIAFYIVLPAYAALMAFVLRRSTNPVSRLKGHLVGLAVWYLGGFAYRAWLPSWSGRTISSYSWIFAYLDWFAVGMLLAVASAWVARGGRLPTVVQELANRAWACWLCAAAAYGVVVLLKGDDLHFTRIENESQMSARFFFQAIAAGFCLMPAMIGSATGLGMAAMRTKAAVFLGSISYGIYLWHPVVITWTAGLIDQSTARSRFVLFTGLVILITLPFAAISFYAFERPITELYRTRAGRRRMLPCDSDPKNDDIQRGRQE